MGGMYQQKMIPKWPGFNLHQRGGLILLKSFPWQKQETDLHDPQKANTTWLRMTPQASAWQQANKFLVRRNTTVVGETGTSGSVP